jgi:REP element-mobilizing transposase RayT
MPTDGPPGIRHAAGVTYPRRQLVPPGLAGTYHCVSRCVRRAFLCGFDRYSGRSFEHRRGWVEQRVLELGDIFAVGVYGYAVMSNHVHVVVSVLPDVARQWSEAEVAARWVRLFPSRDEAANQARRDALVADAERLSVLRRRLADLSWFMRCLVEPIARRGNAEDECKGRFWEGRFKCQALLDERAVLAAMTYVDLNPVRAGIAKSVATSRHTSVARRAKALRAHELAPSDRLRPIAGTVSKVFPPITVSDYVALVDFTGRHLHAGKRGRIAATEPPALRRLGLDAEHWTMQVKGIGSGYWRAVGAIDELQAKASEMGQRWLCGVGLARALAKA